MRAAMMIAVLALASGCSDNVCPPAGTYAGLASCSQFCVLAGMEVFDFKETEWSGSTMRRKGEDYVTFPSHRDVVCECRRTP